MPRLSTTVNDSDLKNLDQIVEATHLERNDAVRKAIATEAFVQRSLSAGAKLLIEMPDGKVRQIEFLS